MILYRDKSSVAYQSNYAYKLNPQEMNKILKVISANR
ncbi:unnamed protein product [Paramecium octaurelia]|uniref:Uncharacterized protein n=1 Tax=Paramecium octaurelia TaxID=43137 RepID=A0A8S1VH10_PAROT|nr:unnamed protein product [Paramecium octaurelia]